VLIWVVEDNPADVYLIRSSLQRHGIAAELRLAQDGEQAIRFIQEADEGGPLPSLALLDLNLPKFSGPEVLKTMRASPRCNVIPVIVVSSAPPLKQEEMLALQIAAYFRKPLDFEEFMRLGELVKKTLDGHMQA